MFLSCTSQGVDIAVKWLISLVVTSNHKCLNKVVSDKLALIIFEPGTQPQRWYMLYSLLVMISLYISMYIVAKCSHDRLINSLYN